METAGVDGTTSRELWVADPRTVSSRFPEPGTEEQ